MSTEQQRDGYTTTRADLGALVARRLREGISPVGVEYVEAGEWEKLSAQEQARRRSRSGLLVTVERLPKRVRQ